VTGASGFLGSATSRMLAAQGHRVIPLLRSSNEPRAARWNPEIGTIDLAPVRSLDAVVHLAGENIGRRWTRARKATIFHSRVEGTQLLSRALAALPQRPKVMVCASACGYYGDRGDQVLEESSGPGAGFLAEVCRQWEDASQLAEQSGIRVVHLRFGIVLAVHGGALAKMLPVFRFGLGGRFGHGRQWWSWIALDDALNVIQWALMNETLSGAVNTVSPSPVTNCEFTRTLGILLRRPTLFAVPAFAARLAFGEMAQEALLSSARVLPARLQQIGFSFLCPTLDSALRYELGPRRQTGL